MSRNDPPAWIQLLAFTFALAAAAWGFWCTIIAFIGGTMPIIGIHVEHGSIIGGLFMLVIGEPILLTIAYWAAMIILLPLIALSFIGKRPSQ